MSGKPQLPGLGPIATLMLVPILAVWLGISGPADLKEWQPLLASVVALGAAGVAYNAAMAKVIFDRQVRAEEKHQRDLGILLRLESFLSLLYLDAQQIVDCTEQPPPGKTTTVRAEDLLLENIDQLEEAWENLHVFPSEIAMHLAAMRTMSLRINLFLRGNEGKTWVIRAERDGPLPSDLERVRRAARDIVEICKGRAGEWVNSKIDPYEY